MKREKGKCVVCYLYYAQYRGVVIEVSGCVGEVYLALGLASEEQK